MVQRITRLVVIKTTTELLNIPIRDREKLQIIIPYNCNPKESLLEPERQQVLEYGILNEDNENNQKIIPIKVFLMSVHHNHLQNMMKKNARHTMAHLNAITTDCLMAKLQKNG